VENVVCASIWDHTFMATNWQPLPMQHVTGGALFPSAGSWNPTLTMCGFAQDLARKIVPKKDQSDRVCLMDGWLEV
jgi:hypothetical protein